MAWRRVGESESWVDRMSSERARAVTHASRRLVRPLPQRPPICTDRGLPREGRHTNASCVGGQRRHSTGGTGKAWCRQRCVRQSGCRKKVSWLLGPVSYRRCSADGGGPPSAWSLRRTRRTRSRPAGRPARFRLMSSSKRQHRRRPRPPSRRRKRPKMQHPLETTGAVYKPASRSYMATWTTPSWCAPARAPQPAHSHSCVCPPSTCASSPRASQRRSSGAPASG